MSRGGCSRPASSW
eukprot:gene25830-biopygen17850